MYASIILPTYNERENVGQMVEALRRVFGDRQDWEVVIVDDDSPDRTWEHAQELGATDPRVRCYRRLDRRGLSSAIVDGMSLGVGERLLVMDADFQHDIERVPALLEALDRADIAVGSRYREGGGVGEWSAARIAMSKLATYASRLVLRLRSSDPMSGFFAVRREAFLRVAPGLNPRGYKILMELLVLFRPQQAAEVSYVFAPRRAGTSKLSGGVIVDFGLSLAELATRNILSARFIKYALVGISGVAVQYASMFLLWSHFLAPERATLAAIGTAALSNYLANNSWTFAERRHTRFGDLLKGLVTFLAISGCGAFINQSITWYLVHLGLLLPLAMAVGIVLSSVWNYFLNLDLTWSGHARPE